MGDISYRTVDRGAPYAADQALVYCRRLFRWALDRDIYGLTGSPVAGISSKDHGVEKKPRTHILSDDDLRLLWAATADLLNHLDHVAPRDCGDRPIFPT